ncbi:MAG: hypothetical protein ACLVJU_00040, partial [Blautia sp.]
MITFILKHRNLQIKLKAENLSYKKQATVWIISFSGETIQTASCVFVTFVLFSKNASFMRACFAIFLEFHMSLNIQKRLIVFQRDITILCHQCDS